MNTEVNEVNTQDAEKSAQAKEQADACFTILNILNNTTTLLEKLVEQGQAFSALGFPDDHEVFAMLNEASAIVFDLGQAMARAVTFMALKHGAEAPVDPSKVN